MKLVSYLKNHPFILYVFLLSFLIFLPTHTHQFVWDDFDFIVNWQALEFFPANWLDLLMGELPSVHKKSYRPIRSLVYGVSYLMWGEQPFGYHLQANIVHAINSVLVYLIAFELTKKKLTAFFSAWLFAWHPIHIEAVTWITASFDTIGILFALISFYTFILFRTQQQAIQFRLAILFAGLSFFTNELMLVLPAFLLAYDYLIQQKTIQSLRAEIKTYLPFLVINSFYWIIRFGFLEINTFHRRMWDSLWSTGLIMFVALKKYLQLLFWPMNQSVNHQLRPDVNAFYYQDYNFENPPIQPELFDWDVLISGIFLLGLITVSFLRRRKNPLLSLFVISFFISLLPVMQLFPRAIIFAERYLYPASVFFSIWLINALLATPVKEKLKIILATCLVIYFGWLTFDRNKAWESPQILWQTDLKKNQSSPTLYLNLADTYFHQDDFETAIKLNLEGLELNPNDYRIRNNLAAAYRQQGKWSLALEEYLFLTKLLPNNYGAFLEAAEMYKHMGQKQQAADYYRMVLNRNPEHKYAKQKYLELTQELNL